MTDNPWLEAVRVSLDGRLTVPVVRDAAGHRLQDPTGERMLVIAHDLRDAYHATPEDCARWLLDMGLREQFRAPGLIRASLSEGLRREPLPSVGGRFGGYVE